MLRLTVILETRLFNALQSAAQAAAGDAQALQRSLHEIVLTDDVFKSERELIIRDIPAWFEVEPMATSSSFWARQTALREYIERHAEQSVAALEPYFPSLIEDQTASLTVYLLPGFAQCYGPREGIQFFALRAHAEPAEALLFLIHVYYHEVSSLFYTPTSRRAAENPDTAELFRHWLLLLIQNEGLANYAVLEPMLDLRDQGGPFAYFAYAGLVGNATATAQAMTLCREILTQLEDDNVQRLRGHISTLLKNPRLPVINLVGIHLAAAIAAALGEPALLEAANREPQEFFRMYNQTGDQLRSYLFGPDAEAGPIFGLSVQEQMQPESGV